MCAGPLLPAMAIGMHGTPYKLEHDAVKGAEVAEASTGSGQYSDAGLLELWAGWRKGCADA